MKGKEKEERREGWGKMKYGEGRILPTLAKLVILVFPHPPYRIGGLSLGALLGGGEDWKLKDGGRPQRPVDRLIR